MSKIQSFLLLNLNPKDLGFLKGLDEMDWTIQTKFFNKKSKKKISFGIKKKIKRKLKKN